MTPTRSTVQQRRLEELACVHPDAAGLDIGSEEIVVAVPPDRDSALVRVYRTFTPELQALLEWLIACGIETVVMELVGGDVSMDLQLASPHVVCSRCFMYTFSTSPVVTFANVFLSEI